ncbi:hypothetical protein GHO03_24450 [Pseudomonas sp. FSL R10-1339]|nr:hypothetical protein [Pseudomonas sp. FSL R10-1339]
MKSVTQRAWRVSRKPGAIHLADVDTSPHGTYQRETDSTVFFNKRTNNVVIIGGDGKFVSGWKLDPATPQFKNYIEKGVLQ